jgi:hypothetical protein
MEMLMEMLMENPDATPPNHVKLCESRDSRDIGRIQLPEHFMMIERGTYNVQRTTYIVEHRTYVVEHRIISRLVVVQQRQTSIHAIRHSFIHYS